jgi:glyoxylase-like metal-dependent hydrolase (beta-lactamase superfamily II)
MRDGVRGVMTLAAALLCLQVGGGAHDRSAPKRLEVAPGIHLFTTEPYGDVGLDGNSIAIVSQDGVLVFDSNGTPAAAAAVLAEIRKLTDAPVRYLVHSHWHWDHWYGAEVYKKAFPDVKIVAHAKTRDLMRGPALDFNRPGLENGLPGYVALLDRRVASAEAEQPPPASLAALKHQRDEARFFLEQKAAVRHVMPDVTFEDRLDLKLGDREIQVLNYGRAVTPGDAFLYLPGERIVVAGDLLVDPVPFALSSYPTGWLRALEKLGALDPAVIVPGHGQPSRDRALLRNTVEVFRLLLREGKASKEKGLDPDQATAAILPALEPLMMRMTAGDPRAIEAFKIYLVDWYLHRVYDELDGRVTDAIAPIPPK